MLLHIDGITKRFPGVIALQDVSFDVKEGEIHAIVGENGAGKSTLMNILSGAYTPDEGRLMFQNQEMNFRDPRHAQETGIAMIHQELSLAPSLSVMENVFVGRLIRNRLGLVDYKKMREECREQLERLGIESIHPDQQVKELSVSQMQLVEIAKALSLHAKLLIMDEPTSSLTQKETDMLLETIQGLSKSGVAILFISHRMEEVFRISERITVFRDGQHIQTLQTSQTNPQEIVSLMVGREFNKAFQRDYKTIGAHEQPLLEVKHVSLRSKVKNAGFSLFRGEVLALTGLVGAGRSELLQTIFGIEKKEEGQILLEGQEVTIGSPVDAIELGIGLVPEGRKTQGLFLDMSVRENISMANLPRMTRHQFICAREETQKADSYRSKLRIKTPHLEQKVKHLSGGNQQKTVIARWLLNEPKVLFLDEPTHGVDVGAKAEIYELINQLAKDGVGIVLISSELPEVLTLADRILVMYQGEITGQLNREEASQEAIMRLATNQIHSGEGTLASA